MLNQPLLSLPGQLLLTLQLVAQAVAFGLQGAAALAGGPGLALDLLETPLQLEVASLQGLADLGQGGGIGARLLSQSLALAQAALGMRRQLPFQGVDQPRG